jgi:hypothetical protein
MTLYFFHVAKDGVTLDRAGTELEDLEAVQSRALNAARELIDLSRTRPVRSRSWKVWVTKDPSGNGERFASVRIRAK